MFSFFWWAVLLFYFWYFYYARSEPGPKPVTSAPLPPNPHFLKIRKQRNNTFQFILDHKELWKHSLPRDPYTFDSRTLTVYRKDPCHPYLYTGRVLATGFPLYDYVSKHPDTQNRLAFEQKTHLTQREGHVFYFNCAHRQIQSVGICPSGTLFHGSRCVPIGPCTGQPNSKKLPDPENMHRYLKCVNGRAFAAACGAEEFFYRDRCVSKRDVAFYCRMEPHPIPLRVSETTLATCLNRKVVYKDCARGMKFFDTNECEPSLCVGRADGHRVRLPDRTLELFRFTPGYATCRAEKIDTVHFCPQTWDASQADEEDVTFLPQVFDGYRCTIPSLCENVLPFDDQVLVPAYNFNKRVKNWAKSDLYDTAVGYECKGGIKRRRILPSWARVKKFRVAEGCEGRPGAHLPLYGRPEHYYDCAMRSEQACPHDHSFNGESCVPRPRQAFEHENVPLFEFNALNVDGWIQPWDYSAPSPGPRVCQPPEQWLSVYDVCSDPECRPYAFLSMVPDFSILLPRTTYRCRFDAQERRLLKEPTWHYHRFWEQQLVDEPPSDPEACTPGQRLKTGHFVWDSTVYATCDETQPFVFCPSVHTTGLVLVHGDYACDTNLSNAVKVDGSFGFADSEVKHVLPLPQHPINQFKLNKSTPWARLPVDGVAVLPKTRVHLESTRPLQASLRYRVTYPPHVYFKYDDLDRVRKSKGSRESGFIVRVEKHTTLALAFPIYKPISHVPSFL